MGMDVFIAPRVTETGDREPATGNSRPKEDTHKILITLKSIAQLLI
ncbi:hypothetical protein Ga0123461_1807 [Mariprofundus aestuarium]|uniref:Uncharacterized protein n=1 Tax=Mariprofundus aestuarium TaxID=1921086 RepID=A0A2K8KYX4_MARES|nr:hypothetical protein Ga0123461_1807 [Mariprofundus aestuarium]